MLTIISGKFKSQKLQAPPSSITRPVSEKVRAAIFNTLGDRVEAAEVLDLFAGSGALGLEALSRGAQEITLVDQSHKATEVIRLNAAKFNADDKLQIHNESVERFVDHLKSRYDIIFCDPPYAELDFNLVERTLNLLQLDGILVLSCSSKVEIDEDRFEVVQQKTYGDTKIAYITK